MEHISLFLKKFEKLGLKEQLIKSEIAQIVNRICNSQLSMKDIVYKDGNVTISGTRMLKSEIFLHKQEIIEEIEQLLGSTKIRKIG